MTAAVLMDFMVAVRLRVPVYVKIRHLVVLHLTDLIAKFARI